MKIKHFCRNKSHRYISQKYLRLFNNHCKNKRLKFLIFANLLIPMLSTRKNLSIQNEQQFLSYSNT